MPRILPAVLALAAIAAACRAPEGAPPAADPMAFTDAERAALLSLSPKPPLPPDTTNRVADDERAAELGHRLFFDVRLSGNGAVACATCHVPGLGFQNARRFGEGVGITTRNVPTVWNSAHERWFFRDGRADSAWAQALGPLENAREHGSSRVALVRVVATSPDLRSRYEAIFGPLPPVEDLARFPEHGRPDAHERWHPHVAPWNAMTQRDRDAIDAAFANLGKAIAAYERRLVGGEAPFDRFVRGLREGDEALMASLPPAAVRGARIFAGKGRCLTCHHGPLLTDLEFHDLYLANPILPPRDTGRFRGVELVLRDPFNAKGPHSDDREGAGAAKLEYLAQRPENWGQFKTASLRNVALTAPYMHDGRFESLADVIRYYRTFEGAVPPSPHGERTLQRVDLTDAEGSDLVAFLEALSDAPPDSPWMRAPVAEIAP